MSHDSIPLDGAQFIKSLTRGLSEPNGSRALGEAAERSAKGRDAMAASIPQWDALRTEANAIKDYAVAQLDKLLVEFEQNITRRGATVLWAQNAREANEHVLNIAREHQVKTVVKSKSMVSEEMELNHALEAAGIRPVETDLGEYIVQLAHQRPTHIVTPALHLSAADVGHLFEEKLKEPFSAEHRHLTDVARRHLRQDFLQADLGISGCNFALADTGTICVVENEGNAGLSTSAPPIHVVLMGIEKVLPSIDYLPVFLTLLGRTATGQKLTSYTHLFHGITPGHKLYVILLDNGRTNVLQDAASRMALFCIRCGACMNACPVYRRIGGWAYGWVYPGPIGAVLTPHLIGMDQAAKLPFASSLCGACSEACPVKIDLPHQLVHLRHRAVNEPSPMNQPLERLTWKLWAWWFSGPKRYRIAMSLVKLGVRLAKFLPWHPGKLGAWTRGRELPRVPQTPAFRDWWRRNGAAVQPKSPSSSSTDSR